MYEDLSGLTTPKRLLAEDLFMEIGMAIVEGRIAPGERVRDSELAAQYQVSRTPVREALQRLERLGLVEMSPSRYTRVTEPSPDDVEDARIFCAYESGVVCALAVPRLRDEEREQAVRIIDEALAAPDDATLARARWALFSLLGPLTGNRMLYSLSVEASMAMLRSIRLWRPDDEQRATSVAGFRDLRAAILAADAEAAERAARAVYAVA